jgi:hypothetical protein
MEPREKGWLQAYLEFRKELLQDFAEETRQKASHPEYSLYRAIQPTGLMYGQIVGDIDFPGSDEWSEKDRMKVLLAESLVCSSLLFHDKPVTSTEDFRCVYEDTRKRKQFLQQYISGALNFYKDIVRS